MGSSKEETKRRLLDAGRQLVVERGLSPTLDLRLTDVLEEVGLTTGAAYNIWDNQDHYRRDLALHMAKTLEWADERLVEDIRAGWTEDIELDDWTRLVARAYFDAFTSRHDYFVILKFWGIKDIDDELREALSIGYDVVHERFRAAFGQSLGRFKRRPIDPFTLDDVCVLITGACEGLALRQRIQPERLDTAAGHLFAEFVVRLVSDYTEPC